LIIFVFSSEDDAEDDLSADDSDDRSRPNYNDKSTAGHEEWCPTTRLTGPNGHRPIDHRPPEKLLRKAEKKVAQCIERKKVTSICYYLMCSLEFEFFTFIILFVL